MHSRLLNSFGTPSISILENDFNYGVECDNANSDIMVKSFQNRYT